MAEIHLAFPSAVTLADSDAVTFGDGNDITMEWDATKLLVGQAAANSAFDWGVDGAGIDQNWYGDTASVKMMWDQSADSLILNDSALLVFGTGSDVTVRWDATDLDILAGADDSVIKFGNGTNSFDIWIYGNTASDNIIFDASANTIAIDGIDLQLKDADILHFGDTIADDARIVFDGTRLVISPLTVGGVIHIGDAADTTGNQVHIFDGGADDPGLLVMYDAAGVPWYVWVDTTGDVRVHSAAPTNEDADGTVVGAQS